MNLLDEKKHIPWIVFRAKDWLDKNIRSDMRVFEWGSGGSTLYFSKRVKEIVSIEHNKIWHEEVSNTIFKLGVKNCEYFLIEPKYSLFSKLLPYSVVAYNSRSFSEYFNFSFRNYVKKIDKFPDNYFDIVFVDGRARLACIIHAIRKIKKGGFLILDNSERELYESAMNKLKKYKRIDFFGHGPYVKEEWKTTIWKIV